MDGMGKSLIFREDLKEKEKEGFFGRKFDFLGWLVVGLLIILEVVGLRSGYVG